MNRIKYEQYHGAAGYDAVARRKIKELEGKVGGGSSDSGRKTIWLSYNPNEPTDPVGFQMGMPADLTAMFMDQKNPIVPGNLALLNKGTYKLHGCCGILPGMEEQKFWFYDFEWAVIFNLSNGNVYLEEEIN